MYIKRIELENIKKYDKKEIEFKNGLNFISGKNGAGKTTIIESIGFALFDFQITASFASYFIKRGEKKGSVLIEFLDKDGKTFIVERKISLTSAGNSWFIRDAENPDIAIISGINEVKAFLKDSLDFYPDDNISEIYEKIISVPQGEFTQMFLGSESVRKSCFDPIFKLDTYKKAFENIKLVKGIESEINAYKEEIAGYLGETKESETIEEEIKLKKNEILDLQNKMLDSSKNEEERKKVLETFENIKSEIEKIKNEKNVKNVEIESARMLIKNKQNELDKIVSIKKVMSENKDNYDLYISHEKKLEVLEKDLKKYEEAKLKSDENMGRVQNGNASVEERNILLKSQEENIARYQKNIEEYKNRNAELEKEYSKLITKVKEDENENTNHDKTNDKEDKFKAFEDASNRIIELSINYEFVLKEIKRQLKEKLNPGKDIMYLNSALKEIRIVREKKLDNEIDMHLGKAEESITSVSEMKKDSSSVSDDENLISKKENIENEIINLYNNFMEEKIEIISDISELKSKFIESFNNMKNKASQVESEKVKIETEIAHNKKSLESFEKELNLLLNEHKLKTDEKNKWVNAIEDIKKKIEILAPDVKQYHLVNSDINTMKEEMKKIKSSHDVYVTSEARIKNEEEIKASLTELNDKLKLLLSILDEINKKYDSFKFDEDGYNNAKKEYEEALILKNTFEEKLRILNESIKKLDEKLIYFKELKNKIQMLNKEIMYNEKMIEIINKLRNVIKLAPFEIANMLIKSISNRASDIYSEIASDSNRLSWENFYELVLYDYSNGKEIRKEFKMLSGGEQMSCALSVRIAMLEMLTKLKIGILDEPTVNMDTLRRTKFAEVVGNISEKFNQLIVVSHDDSFESITENIIEL